MTINEQAAQKHSFKTGDKVRDVSGMTLDGSELAGTHLVVEGELTDGRYLCWFYDGAGKRRSLHAYKNLEYSHCDHCGGDLPPGNKQNAGLPSQKPAATTILETATLAKQFPYWLTYAHNNGV